MMVAEPGASQTGLLDALLVYAEPLASGARVVVVGEDLAVAERLRDVGARHVRLVADPTNEELDVRDGAFDLAVVTDVGALSDPGAAVRRLRRVVAESGAIVALARARTEDVVDAPRDAFPEVAPAVVGYAELYDLFALQFDSVALAGVLPFSGVVFAQLGGEEDVPVAVDARLAPPASPDVFVVVASRDPIELDPYAIVQVPGVSVEPIATPARERASEAELAAAVLEAKLLTAQLEEQRARNVQIEARSGASEERLEALARERDAALGRVAELEAIALAARHALGDAERRLRSADQAIRERDETLAALKSELDERDAEDEDADEDEARIDPELVAELEARAQRAEAALALNVADLAAHASETAALEEQLRERAKVIAAMEKELARRAHLVRELVAALEDAREGQAAVRFEAAPAPPVRDHEEVARLTRKIDELALEIARREGELVAQAWRIEELENDRAPRGGPAPGGDANDPLARDLAAAKDEIDALRQALTQEHAARVAAESGEALARARAELAQKAALLEQLKARAQPSSE